MNRQDEQVLEVEVLSVDDHAPTATCKKSFDAFPSAPSVASPPAGRSRDFQTWRNWQARLPGFNSRWWPLWVVLGATALFLLLTVGFIAAVLVLIFLMVRKFCRSLRRLFP